MKHLFKAVLMLIPVIRANAGHIRQCLPFLAAICLVLLLVGLFWPQLLPDMETLKKAISEVFVEMP